MLAVHSGARTEWPLAHLHHSTPATALLILHTATCALLPTCYSATLCGHPQRTLRRCRPHYNNLLFFADVNENINVKYTKASISIVLLNYSLPFRSRPTCALLSQYVRTSSWLWSVLYRLAHDVDRRRILKWILNSDTRSYSSV